MDSSFAYYAFCLIAAIVGFIVLKKVTGCVIKMVVTFVAVAIIAAIYFLYIRQ